MSKHPWPIERVHEDGSVDLSIPFGSMGNASTTLDAQEVESLAIALIHATPSPSTRDGMADANEALVFIDSDGAERAMSYGLALIRAAASKEGR